MIHKWKPISCKIRWYEITLCWQENDANIPLWNLLCIYHIHLQSDSICFLVGFVFYTSHSMKWYLAWTLLHTVNEMVLLLYHEFVHKIIVIVNWAYTCRTFFVRRTKRCDTDVLLWCVTLLKELHENFLTASTRWWTKLSYTAYAVA